MTRNRFRALAGVGLSILVFGSFTVLVASTPSDAQLRSVAQERLYNAKVGSAVSVSVENGMATLEGRVDSVGLKHKAEKAVVKVDGIRQVTNKLLVDFAGSDDTQIVSEAARRIRGYAFYSIFDHIDISSAGGNLVLEGQVTQPWRRDDIVRLVEMVPGVRTLESKLEVLPVSPFDDEIRRRVARAIYREPGLVRYGIQPDPPIHIVVKNGNVVLTGVVNSAVEKALAERAARFAATYFSFENRLLVESEMRRARS